MFFFEKENPGFYSRVDICFSGINELNSNTIKKLFTLSIDIEKMNYIYDMIKIFFVN